MDLAQLVADERWDALDDFIQGLPPNSHLNEGMANDPDYADQIAEQDEPGPEWAPRISQWDLAAVMRAEQLAALHGIQSAILLSNGGKPVPYKPFPRPVTEIEGARERLEKRATGAMLEMAGFNPSDYL